jgi:hypothetical protein
LPSVVSVPGFKNKNGEFQGCSKSSKYLDNHNNVHRQNLSLVETITCTSISRKIEGLLSETRTYLKKWQECLGSGTAV